MATATLQIYDYASMHVCLHRAQVIAGARQVWADTFGKPRNCAASEPKFTSGIKRQAASVDQLTTESAWIKRRRHSVAAISRAASSCHADGHGVVMEDMPEALQDEAKFQQKKALAHKVTAMREGVLLDDEITTELLQASAEMKIREGKATQIREAKMRRLQSSMKEGCGPSYAELEGAKTLVEGGLLVGDLSCCLAKRKVSVTESWREANIITVSNPGRLGMRALWTAALQGLFVVTPAFWFDRGGAIVKYVGAMTERRARFVWVTQRFRERHAGIWKILQHFRDMQESSRRWRWLESKEEFKAQKRWAHSKGFNSKVLALLVSDECSDPDHLPSSFSMLNRCNVRGVVVLPYSCACSPQAYALR